MHESTVPPDATDHHQAPATAAHAPPPDDASLADENRQLYFPAPGEQQLTWRATLAGCLIGSVVSCTNIYMGLKIGWTFGASIITAVLAYALFDLLGRRLSVLEVNCAQTSGSAAGYMSSAAGLVSSVPAMMLLGTPIPWQYLFPWGIATAFLGVFFAVPLRRQVLLHDRLRFPSGLATAQTISAMYSEASEATAKAKVLLWTGGICAALTLANYFVPQIQEPPVHEWLTIAAVSLPFLAPLAGALTTAAQWSFSLSLGPALLGAGFMIGPRVVLSLVGGAILSWGILGPLAQHQGWAPGASMSYGDGARGWILWPGVALMVSEALTALALSWRTFLNALTMSFSAIRSTGTDSGALADEEVPPAWWIGGLAAGSVATIIIAQFCFGIVWYFSLIAIVLSFVLSIVAVRAVGESDINPVGGMGKVTQLVFGGLAPGSTTTNLMAAAITGAGASQAGDMMTDLKTGQLLGASPRKQFVAQLYGILAGIIFTVPAYVFFVEAYELGGKQLPAPAAMAWKAMAELLSKGFSSLPPFSREAIAIACAVGILIPVLRLLPKLKNIMPSGLAMGIAFIVPATSSLQMALGLLAWVVWRRINPRQCDRYTFAVASGMVAGEGLMGIVNALLTILRVPTLTGS